MKKRIIASVVFVFIFTLQINCQPQLVSTCRAPELPLLEVSMISEPDTLFSFIHKDGIVISDEASEHWQLYKYLKGCRDLGQIIKVFKFGHDAIVSMEKGSVVYAKGNLRTLDYTIIGAHSGRSGMYCIASSLKNNEESFSADDRWPDRFYNANSYVKINLRTDSITITRIAKPVYKIRSVCYHSECFWMSGTDDLVDGWKQLIVRIDTNGMQTESEVSYNLYSSIKLVGSHKNKLFFVSDSGLYEIDGRLGLKKISSISKNPGHIGCAKMHGNYLYILPRDYVLNEWGPMPFVRINMDTYKCEHRELPLGYTFFKISTIEDLLIRGTSFYLSIGSMNVIARVNESSSRKTFYKIRDGITNFVYNMAEDDREAWFVTNAIFRLSKADSSWRTYWDYSHYYLDSATLLTPWQVTMNEDFVFITMEGNNAVAKRYLVFDRKNETFELLTGGDLIKKFFVDNGGITDYKGRPFVIDRQKDTLAYFVHYLPEWTALLFFYHLPLGGFSGGQYNNTMIRKDDYVILSAAAYKSPEDQFHGLLVYSFGNKTLRTVRYPRKVKYFGGCCYHPHLITGDINKVWVANRDRDNYGIFSLDLRTLKVESDTLWQKTFNRVRWIQKTDKYLVISAEYSDLFLLGEDRQDISVLNRYITAEPGPVYITGKYYFIVTPHETVYFDKEFKYLGNLGLYNALQTEHDLYFEGATGINMVKMQ